MSKKLSGMVMALMLGLSIIGLAACSNGGTQKEFGRLFISDIKNLVEGSSAPIEAVFSDENYAADITYSFDGDAIKIEDGKVYALAGGKSVKVRATTTYHVAVFTVTTKNRDYGSLHVPNVNAFIGYPASEFSPVFSNEDYASDIEYSYDNTALTLDKDAKTVTAKKAGNHTVTAQTANHSTKFTVTCHAAPDQSTAEYNTEKYDAKAQQWAQKWVTDKSDGDTTVFIGDSFFDVQSFWTNFYTTYAQKNVQCFGIGGTTSYDWEKYLEGWLKELQPKNIVMHVGTNNLYDDSKSAADTIVAIERMFTLMHGKMPNTKIYYFGITQRDYGNQLKIDETNAVNKSMQSWCGSRSWITYLDTSPKITADMLKDKIHLKLECYSVMVDELAASDIVIDELPVADIERDKSQTIGTAAVKPLYYNKELKRNYVLEGKIDITEIINNAHIEFRFNGDANRMLLWNRASDGQFKVGYNYNNGGYNTDAAANATYAFTSGTTLTLGFKLVVTSSDAYLFINDSFVLAFIDIAGSELGLILSSEAATCRFYDMQIATKADTLAEYNEKLSEIDTVIEAYKDAASGAKRPE